MLDEVSKATEMLYNERKNFTIIGLTGLTGSGCTSVANLLNKEFKDLKPPKPKENNCLSNEDRKYNIVYNYSKENWSSFKIIQFVDIITSFVVECNFDCFISFLEKSNIEIDDFPSLKEKLEKEIKERFDELHIKRVQIKVEINENIENLKKDKIHNFFFEELPNFTIEIQRILKIVNPNLYTKIYQEIGNNVRTSGEPYNNKFTPENIFKLSQRTNTLIKMLRKRNIEKKGRVLVVIDAIRNPYEATFFKDRYSAFYLFSINTDEETRKQRLLEKGLTLEQVNKIKDIEYSSKKPGKDKFSALNLQKCIELSDVFMYNPTKGHNDFNFLKKQLVTYISLIMHPGIITPTHIERCMQIAFNAKLNSGCLSRQVGAVVTDDDYSIKTVGWNSSPEGQVTCNLRDLSSLLSKDDNEGFSNYERNNKDFFEFLKGNYEKNKNLNKLNGRIFCYCFKDAHNTKEGKKNQVHTRSLHAEENAFLQLAKYGGMGVKNGYLFTTASPCELCSKKAYQLGIKTIYYIDPYPGISKEHIFNIGIKRPEMEIFFGAIGRAYNQFYTPILPYKDELAMLMDFEFKQLSTPAGES